MALPNPEFGSVLCSANCAVNDYRCKKAIENLPRLRENMSAVIDKHHNIQRDILETFIDRGQLRRLVQPTILPNGKRIPGLKLDHPGNWL